MTIENWVTVPRPFNPGDELLVMSVPADPLANRVLCGAVQGAAAALGGRGVGEDARQAVSAACALVLGNDDVGGRLTVRVTGDSDHVTAEVVGDLPRSPSRDEVVSTLAERLLAGFAERWAIEPGTTVGGGPVHRVWLELSGVAP